MATYTTHNTNWSSVSMNPLSGGRISLDTPRASLSSPIDNNKLSPSSTTSTASTTNSNTSKSSIKSMTDSIREKIGERLGEGWRNMRQRVVDWHTVKQNLNPMVLL